MSSKNDNSTKYVRFEYPLPRRHRNGIIDEICRICGDWVIKNSTFDKRYYHIQGNWEDKIPIGDARVLPNTIDGKPGFSTIPICDLCFEKIGYSYPKRHTIMFHQFIIHACYRMNSQ